MTDNNEKEEFREFNEWLHLNKFNLPDGMTLEMSVQHLMDKWRELKEKGEVK